MKELNLLEGLEKAESEFFEHYLQNALTKLKAVRRALILILMVRDHIGLSEKAGSPFDEVEQTYIELAAAVFANGRAAFLLIMKGYLFPTQTLLRALWEQVIFMEYFRLYPDEGCRWAAASEPSTARTPSPTKAWGAIRARARDSVLGGKQGRVYEYLSKYSHSQRHALFDLTVSLSDTTAGTSFGPAHRSTNLDFTLQFATSLLVSAIEVLVKVFETRIRETEFQPLQLLPDILELAFGEPPSD